MRRASVIGLLVVAAVLAVILFSVRNSEPSDEPQPRPFVWRVDVERLRTIEIILPRLDASQSWIRKDDKYWYFDEPDGRRVDMQRWGGGVPLLVSGVGADRVIAENADPDVLRRFGLSSPEMILRVTVAGGETIEAHVGSLSPDGRNHYVRLADGEKVYTVDHTWSDVLSDLVTDPPYPD